MRNKLSFLSLPFTLLLCSCGTEDYVDVLGQIEGTVINSDTE